MEVPKLDEIAPAAPDLWKNPTGIKAKVDLPAPAAAAAECALLCSPCDHTHSMFYLSVRHGSHNTSRVLFAHDVALGVFYLFVGLQLPVTISSSYIDV